MTVFRGLKSGRIDETDRKIVVATQGWFAADVRDPYHARWRPKSLGITAPEDVMTRLRRMQSSAVHRPPDRRRAQPLRARLSSANGMSVWDVAGRARSPSSPSPCRRDSTSSATVTTGRAI